MVRETQAADFRRTARILSLTEENRQPLTQAAILSWPKLPSAISSTKRICPWTSRTMHTNS